ncbi:MAG: hypothetical protein NVS2B16_06780 [Chloroflexota bacterium]
MKVNRPRFIAWIVLLMVSINAGTATAGTMPSLGMAQKQIDAAWTRDGKSGACRRENLALSCHYLYRGIRIVATFNDHHTAEQFQTDGKTHRNVDVWRFLNLLVPRGSRLLGCRFVRHSTGGGTAHACLYHLTRNMIVAYFPHPADTDFGGLVTYDYEEYKDIQAGR